MDPSIKKQFLYILQSTIGESFAGRGRILTTSSNFQTGEAASDTVQNGQPPSPFLHEIVYTTKFENPLDFRPAIDITFLPDVMFTGKRDYPALVNKIRP